MKYLNNSQDLPEDDDDEEEADKLLAKECESIREAALPALQLPDDLSRPLGQGSNGYDTLDLSALVKMRYQHQTRHAEQSVRVKGSDNPEKSRAGEDSVRCQLIKQFHAVLKEQQGQGIGTGIERGTRWRSGNNTGPGPALPSESITATGNAANAAEVASRVARTVRVFFSIRTSLSHTHNFFLQALTRRRNVFKDVKLQCLAAIGEARINVVRPLTIQDFCIVFTEHGLRVGQGIAFQFQLEITLR